MLYNVLLFFLICSIAILMYLIYLKKLAIDINELQNFHYNEKNQWDPYLECDKQFYYQKDEYLNPIAKKLSFSQAFEISDKILFSNHFSSENLVLNKEILGSTPRPQKNFINRNSSPIPLKNKNIVDIDLTKENCPFFANNYNFQHHHDNHEKNKDLRHSFSKQTQCRDSYIKKEFKKVPVENKENYNFFLNKI